MPVWVYLVGFSLIVLTIAVGAVFFGARTAPKNTPVGPLVLFLLAVFCLDSLPVPPALEAVADYAAMAALLWFLYRSGPMLKAFVYRRSG